MMSLKILQRASRSAASHRFAGAISTSVRHVPSTSTSSVLPSNLTARFRFMSDDSHSDFSPKRKAVKDEDEAHQMIREHVQNNHIMLYMKGNPSMPMCGFSAKVVQALKDEGADFSSVNVLDYPAIRDGVKQYSEWPTIPQLYVNGEFIGGCDIITGMQESGELGELLKAEKKEE